MLWLLAFHNAEPLSHCIVHCPRLEHASVLPADLGIEHYTCIMQGFPCNLGMLALLELRAARVQDVQGLESSRALANEDAPKLHALLNLCWAVPCWLGSQCGIGRARDLLLQITIIHCTIHPFALAAPKCSSSQRPEHPLYTCVLFGSVQSSFGPAQALQSTRTSLVPCLGNPGHLNTFLRLCPRLWCSCGSQTRIELILVPRLPATDILEQSQSPVSDSGACMPVVCIWIWQVCEVAQNNTPPRSTVS